MHHKGDSDISSVSPNMILVMQNSKWCYSQSVQK